MDTCNSGNKKITVKIKCKNYIEIKSRKFKSDRKIILEGIRKDVLEVLKNDGYILRHADENFKA